MRSDPPTMKAAFLTAVRKIEIREVPLPAIGRPDDVLLRVATLDAAEYPPRNTHHAIPT